MAVAGMIPQARKLFESFMQQRGVIDCLIPRGGASLIAFVMWQARETRVPTTPTTAAVGPALGQNPLALASSLQMAVAFQVVLFAIAWVQQAVGATGVLLSATLLGLTDVDALTVSMTRYGADPANVRVAAAAIGMAYTARDLFQ